MAEETIKLEPIERLTFENIFLKEEILKRDLTKVNGEKNTFLTSLLTRYKIDPDNDKYTINGQGELIVLRPATTMRQFGTSNGAEGRRVMVEEELTAITGASVTTTSLVPAGTRLLFVSARVTASVSGATTFDVGDETDVDRFGAAIILPLGTTVDNTDATADPGGFSTSVQDVILTANGSDFTAGSVRIAAWYEEIGAPTS